MKKSIVGIIAAVVVFTASLVWLSCTKEEEIKGIIYGTVTDYATGEPIGNANVKLRPSGETTLTGSDGTYEFKDLKEDNYSLQLSKAGYADLDDDYIIELEAGKKVKRDVQMRKRIASLQVTDMNGNPLDTLDFGAEESVTVKTFNLFNDGTEILICTADYGDCGWITNVSGLENSIQPGQTKAVTVRIDRVALEDGVNTTFLYITSGNGSNEIVVKASFLGTTVITTQNATNVTASSATVGGNITDDGGRPVLERGICYGTSQSPDINGDHTQDGSGTGTFSHNITGLNSSTTYYARAYATNRNGTYYASNIISFTTTDGLPTVTTTDVSDITATTAKSGGNVTSNGGYNVTARGVCWNTQGGPDLNDSHITNGSGNGTFTSNMTNLEIGTTYYVRAYATNSQGTSYGEEKNFTTTSGNVTFEFSAPTNITAQSATCTATITDNGGAPVAMRGFCWSTSQYPTADGDHVDLGMGSGEFTSTITGLQPATTYYVRAYAINTAGTAYSTQHSFTTTSGLPTIATATVNNITATTAVSGGTISDNGGFNVTARGVCWNTIGNPDLNGSHTTNGTGNGTFTSNLTGLTPGTTYHVRAYATNSTGTSYGNETTFTTSSGSVTMTLADATNITASSASCSVTISDDGGAAITERGICWSTAQYPTTTGSHVDMGSGTGTFSVSMTSLSPSTTYYVRAYAVNAAGTFYSNQIELITQSGLPTVTTTTPTLTDITVTTGGNVTSDGGFAVTARGVCYGNLPYPDLTSTYSHTTNGSGTGYYSSSFSLPLGSGIYYIRAYATNANGTSYGEQVTVVHPYDALPTFTFDGLTFKVAPTATGMTWEAANEYCNTTMYGYSDWRMPTEDELEEMYANRASIGGFVTSNCNLSTWESSPCYYWSSDSVNNAYIHRAVKFYNGIGINCSNGFTLSVRPIRMGN